MKRIWMFSTIGLVVLFALNWVIRHSAAAESENEAKKAAAKASAKGDRFFEFRKYTAAPGKLEALHARFRDHTNALFVKHGMALIGYWTPIDGEEAKNTLIYILAYPDREAREKSWKAFQDDPEWKKAKAESEKDGPLVSKAESKFIKATDYSPIR